MEPVHDAAERNDVEELRRLLDEDPGLIERAYRGATPLFFACRHGSVDAARLLIARGARTHHGGLSISLYAACYAGRAEIVQLLLARGADPGIRAPIEWTAMGVASRAKARRGSDHAAVIRVLLEDGRVQVNEQDSQGRTALWWACQKRHLTRARVLLLEGFADHTIVDQQGFTPKDTAGRQKCHSCVQLLRWYEGQLERPYVLSKARAVMDASESITKAPQKVGARTEAEAQRAREEAAPAYLKDRVRKREALPEVLVGPMTRRRAVQEEERGAVVEFAVKWMSEDLYIEMMEGLVHRRWLPK